MQMKTADAIELRDNAPALLNRVKAGEEIAITLAGKPFARLVPVKSEECQIESQPPILGKVSPP
jgi:prevent-host-death family protein